MLEEFYRVIEYEMLLIQINTVPLILTGFLCTILEDFIIMTFHGLCRYVIISYLTVFETEIDLSCSSVFSTSCLTAAAVPQLSILFTHLLMNYTCAWEDIFRNVFTEKDLSSIISAIRQLKFLLNKIDVQI